jgi:hypothetical protein
MACAESFLWIDNPIQAYTGLKGVCGGRGDYAKAFWQENTIYILLQ